MTDDTRPIQVLQVIIPQNGSPADALVLVFDHAAGRAKFLRPEPAVDLVVPRGRPHILDLDKGSA